MSYAFSLLLEAVKPNKIWAWEIPTPKTSCSSQEVLSDSESEKFDQDEQIALKFCDENEIILLLINMLQEMTVKQKLGQNQLTKKPKFIFCLVLQFIMDSQNRYHHKIIEKTKNSSWNYYCNRGKVA